MKALFLFIVIFVVQICCLRRVPETKEKTEPLHHVISLQDLYRLRRSLDNKQVEVSLLPDSPGRVDISTDEGLKNISSTVSFFS